MYSYNILLLSLLIFGSRLFAAGHEDATTVHVKVQIVDLVHNYRKYYDRYVQPTISLRELIEREKVLCMEEERGSVETFSKTREMVLDEHIYCGDNRLNLQDSIQKHAPTVLYLKYRVAPQVSVKIKIADSMSGRDSGSVQNINDTL